MLTIATILLIVGLTLLVGPYVLKLLLFGVSSLAPASVGTTVYLCVLLIAFMVCTLMYGGTLGEKTEEKDRRRQVRKKRINLRKAITTISGLAILSMILIVLNSVLTTAYESWCLFMDAAPQLFAVLRYIGGVMLVGAIGFFLGKKYKEDSEVYLPETADYYDEEKEKAYGDAAGVYPNIGKPQYHIQNLGAVETRRPVAAVRDSSIKVVFSNPDDARRKLGN